VHLDFRSFRDDEFRAYGSETNLNNRSDLGNSFILIRYHLKEKDNGSLERIIEPDLGTFNVMTVGIVI
jgi:hypothetical protein